MREPLADGEPAAVEAVAELAIAVEAERDSRRRQREEADSREVPAERERDDRKRNRAGNGPRDPPRPGRRRMSFERSVRLRRLRVERADELLASVLPDHRGEHGPPGPAAADPARHRVHPDEIDRAPEGRVAKIEPAHASAIDHDGAAREEPAPGDEALAVVRELEVPVGEERAGDREERGEQDGRDRDQRDAEYVRRRAIGRRFQKVLGEAAREVVREVGDRRR